MRARIPRPLPHRIKVIEAPGCDYPAPEHDLNNELCWCRPVVEDVDEWHASITHREFEN